jgi:hypothetical protein
LIHGVSHDTINIKENFNEPIENVLMKIYLDLCVYNRPFDDQRQPRIAVEIMEFLLL